MSGAGRGGGTDALGAMALRVALYLALVGPIALLGLYAFAERWFFPALLPPTWTAGPLLRQLGDPRVRESLATSLLVAGLTTGLALLVGYPAARALGTRRFRGRAAAMLLLALPGLTPPAATGMGLNIIALRLGLAGSVAGVVIVHLIPVLPYVVLTLAGVFARYDQGYEWQAATLGASPGQVFGRVTLPLLLPALLVAGLFAFLISWSQYLLTLLVGGGRVLTLPLLLFAATSGGNPATIAALALIFVGPPLLAVLAVGRFLTVDAARQI